MDSNLAKIGAYYQCFKNKPATDYVLAGFRHFYPDAPIILVSDGGDDFSDLAQKYNCLYFWRPNIPSHNGKELAYNRENWLVWWKEFHKYVSLIEAEYIIFLEDDVDIRKPISEEALIYDVNGLSEPILTLDILDTRFPTLCGGKVTVGAQGGALFRKAFLMKLFEQDKTIGEDFKEFNRVVHWSKLRGRWPSDIVLSFLTHRNGGTMGEWPGYCRTFDADYPRKVQEDSIEVLHLYKTHYKDQSWRKKMPSRYKDVPYKRKF